jgi:hypothetical protein
MERLHPESLRQLRALVKLHGARAVEKAVRAIVAADLLDQIIRTTTSREKHDE